MCPGSVGSNSVVIVPKIRSILPRPRGYPANPRPEWCPGGGARLMGGETGYLTTGFSHLACHEECRSPTGNLVWSPGKLSAAAGPRTSGQPRLASRNM